MFFTNELHALCLGGGGMDLNIFLKEKSICARAHFDAVNDVPRSPSFVFGRCILKFALHTVDPVVTNESCYNN